MKEKCKANMGEKISPKQHTSLQLTPMTTACDVTDCIASNKL